MQDKDSIRGSINKRMTVVHRCIRTPNIVLSVHRSIYSASVLSCNLVPTVPEHALER